MNRLHDKHCTKGWYQVKKSNKELIHSFISKESAGKRYALARNEHSEALSRAVELDAFIDDFAEPGSRWHDKPVVRIEDTPPDAIVINCVMSISPVSAAKNLEKAGLTHILSYADLYNAFPERFEVPPIVRETREDYENHRAGWEEIEQNMADEESGKTLRDLLSYRLTGDYSSMYSYSVRLNDQYFEDFLNLGPGEVFVDCGGFDGDTAQEYCRRYPGYKKIYFFEPFPGNLENAKKRLKDFPDIEYIEMGVSDKDEILRFDPSGSASAINMSGAVEIKVTTIDGYIDEKITFVKMDLEGWELKALEGCRNHIENDHPKLAIAVYHRPQDFREIYEFIKNLRSDYDVYLRHYTEGWSETVMFFVPKAP